MSKFFKPKIVLVSFTSGSKGGVGKSTIVSSLPLLLNRPCVIIDLGVDGNLMCSRLHRVPSPPRDGLLDYLLFGKEISYYESRECENCVIIPISSPEIPTQRIPFLTLRYRSVLEPRFQQLLLKLSKRFEVCLIDLPANPKVLGLVYPLVLYYSHIINFVCEPMPDSIAALDRWSQDMIESGVIDRTRQTVNVIVNKYLPTMNVASLRTYAMRGSVFVVQYDVSVPIALSQDHIPVKVKECARFRSDLLKFVQHLGIQINKYYM